MAYSKTVITQSKKDCTCAETGASISKWDEILFDADTKKVYCKNSKKFKKFR